MHPGLLQAALCALLSAASPPETGPLLAEGVPSDAASSILLGATPDAAEVADSLQKSWVGALPPAPTVVVRTTKMFGTVTVDHAAHLRRRIRCVSCHDPGPVQKIVFTPQTAHDRCRGCHQKQAGPTDCRGCHVVTPPPSATTASVSPSAKSAGTAPATTVTGTQPGTTKAAAEPPTQLASAWTPPPERPERVLIAEDGREPFARSARFGFVTAFGTKSQTFGPSVELGGRSGPNLVSYTLTSLDGFGETQLLVSAGRLFAVRPRVRANLMATGGLDAVHRHSALCPVAGLRAGVDVMNPSRFLPNIAFSVSALRSFAQPDSLSAQRGDYAVLFTTSSALDLARR